MNNVEQCLIAHTPHILRHHSNISFKTFPQPSNYSKKILVLDLDETLVSSTFDKPATYDFTIPITFDGGVYDIYVRKRPGLDQFLSRVLETYELYIFTASLPEYSIPLVRGLIPDFPENRILTRKHCKCFNGLYIKDLSIFGCDLARILIIDDKSCSYCLQPQNGIKITTWTGDQNDSELLMHALPLLHHCLQADDVRHAIRQMK